MTRLARSSPQNYHRVAIETVFSSRPGTSTFSGVLSSFLFVHRLAISLVFAGFAPANVTVVNISTDSMSASRDSQYGPLDEF